MPQHYYELIMTIIPLEGGSQTCLRGRTINSQTTSIKIATCQNFTYKYVAAYAGYTKHWLKESVA